MISFLHDCFSLERYVGEYFDFVPHLAFPLFIDISLSFILLFNLTKPHSWILLVDSFPMTVTILKYEFQIKSYGLPNFPKPNLTVTTSLPRGPLSLVPYDVALAWMLT
jgi:hypothetical protein